MKTSTTIKKLRSIGIMCVLFVATWPAEIFSAAIVTVPNLSPADTIPNDSVIFTEVKVANASTYGFLEITNKSSRTIDLVNFFLQGRYIYRPEPYIGSKDNRCNIQGILKPGQSFLLVLPTPDLTLDEYGAYKYNYPKGYFCNEAIYRMADQIDVGGSMRFTGQYGLFSRYLNKTTNTIDSVAIDVFNAFKSDQPSNEPIAGVAGMAIQTHWIRKTNVLKGNHTDWTLSRGTSIVDSEWLPVPRKLLANFYDLPFASVKIATPGDITTVKPKNGISIDLVNNKIVFPYGHSRQAKVGSDLKSLNIYMQYSLSGRFLRI